MYVRVFVYMYVHLTITYFGKVMFCCREVNCESSKYIRQEKLGGFKYVETRSIYFMLLLNASLTP